MVVLSRCERQSRKVSSVRQEQKAVDEIFRSASLCVTRFKHSLPDVGKGSGGSRLHNSQTDAAQPEEPSSPCSATNMQSPWATFDRLARLQTRMLGSSPRWVNHSEQPSHFSAIRISKQR